MLDTASSKLAHNVRRLGHLDLPGGGQVYVSGHHAYVGHMKPPHGTSIIDISDPKNPKLVKTLMLPDTFSHTHKVRVVGDIMITNVEMNDRHFLKKAEKIPAAKTKLHAAHGRAPSDAEMAAEIGASIEDYAKLAAHNERGYREGGFKVWDVKNPADPKLLSYTRTHGFGVHRFDMDANYAYISTEMEGYIGNILVTYDLKDPTKPREVARWWMPGQHLAGGEKPTWPGTKNRLHHALRYKDQMWASVWYAGLRVVDVSDITKPKTIGSYNYHPPFPEPTHTIFPVPFKLKGRDVAVAIDEEHDHVPGQPHAGMMLLDVSDLSDIKPISLFQVSELASPWINIGRFGAHQFQEHMRNGKPYLYTAWFAGGLRIVDISDPQVPTEIAFFMPEPCGGRKSPQSNDVDLDDRGLIYMLDRDCGFDVLEHTA